MCRPDDFPPYPVIADESWQSNGGVHPVDFDDDGNPDEPDAVMQASGLFRELDPQEETAFRAWAHANWQPGQDINPLWHPVVRDECERMRQTRAFRDRMEAES